MPESDRPIVVDLFAGAGGLALGFEQAGFDIAVAVEYDPVHCAVHEYNFPQAAIICGEVQNLTGHRIRERAGLHDREIDVVVGGPPCQGFSLIGKRKLNDERNNLVLEFTRIVRELKPKYVVMENVPGMLAGKQRQVLDRAIDDLKRAGYKIKLPVEILDARDYGVPQARRRVFMLAAREDQDIANYPVPTHYHIKTPVEQQSQRRLGPTPTVADAIADLPNADLYDELVERDWVVVSEPWHTSSPYAAQLRGIMADAEDFSYPRRHPRDLLTSSLRTEHTAKSRQRFAETEPGKTEPISRFFKLDPNGYCNTLRAGTAANMGAFTAPRPIHPRFARVITVREAARLHSYPDSFRFHVTKHHGFRQIGNSVPPRLARAVAGSIMQALGAADDRVKPTELIEVDTQSMELLKLDPKGAAIYYGIDPSIMGKRTRKEQSADETAAAGS